MNKLNVESVSQSKSEMGQNERDKSPLDHRVPQANSFAAMNGMLLEYEVKKKTQFQNSQTRFPIDLEFMRGWQMNLRDTIVHFTSMIDLHENRDKSTCQWQHTINAATKRSEEKTLLWNKSSSIDNKLSAFEWRQSHGGIKREIISHSF